MPTNPARARAERAAGTKSRTRILPAIGPLGASTEAPAGDLTNVSPDPAPAAPEPTGPIPADLHLAQLIASPLNPRRSMEPEPLRELATSIAAQGLLEPLMVRPAAPALIAAQDPPPALPAYEVIMGARRCAAARLAAESGWLPDGFTLPVRIRDASDIEVIKLALAENMQRQDMDPLDEAEAFANLRARGMADKAICAEIGINERLLYRRFQLLRLAPEAAVALAEKKITLGQAMALAAGPAEAQAIALQDALDPEVSEYWKTPKGLQDKVTGRLPRATDACFDLALYAGERQEGEDGVVFLTDVPAFHRLQQAWLDQHLAELRADPANAFVDQVLDRHDFYKYSSAYDQDEAALQQQAGRVVFATPDMRSIEIRRAYRPGVPAAFRRGATVGTGGAPAAAPPRLALTEAQRVALHHARTRALRRAVAEHDDPRIGPAIAILGLLGAPDIYIAMRNLDQQDNVPLPIVDELALDRVFAPLAEALATIGHKRKGYGLDGYWDHVDRKGVSVHLFKALLAMPLSELLALLQHLVAGRIGSWCRYEVPIGADPLPIAIAEEVQAAEHLDGVWQPDAEFLRAYSRDDLLALAHSLGVGAGQPLNRLKKGELLELFFRARHGTVTPGRLPEAAFAPAAAIEAGMRHRPYYGPSPLARAEDAA